MATREARRKPVPIDAVRAVVVSLLPEGHPALSLAAARLGTSERSLQRWLSQQGVKYRELVGSVRCEEALKRLAGDASIKEIAQALGYMETSHFTRAFNRWTGMTPRAYRASTSTRTTTRTREYNVEAV